MRAPIAATIAVAVSLMAVPGAMAGGWATVELSSTPDQAAGQTWNVDVTVLQHGRTPLTNVTPEVIINDGTGPLKFVARPTGRPGVYRAEVVFPRAGTWRYAVWDGFTRRHSYPAVRIGTGPAAPASAARSGGADDGLPWPAIVLALAGGLAAAGLVFTVQRRRTPHGET